MYKQQQEPGWAGQLNDDLRTDDLDGAAEGENETRRVIPVVQNPTVPSRPRSRDSHYHDRDDSNASSRVRSHAGRDDTRRRRNDSYANIDRERMMNSSRGVDEYGYDYNRRPRPSQQHDRTMYPDSYYHQMGAFNQSRGYPMQMSAPQMSSREHLARLRIECPVIYREWYSKFQMHKNNPHQVPFPPIPQFPNQMITPFVGGPMSNVGYPSQYNLPPQGQPNLMQTFNGDTGYDRPNIHSGNNSDNGNGRPSGRSSVVELGGFNSSYHGYPVNRTPSMLNFPVDENTMSITDYGPSGTETPPPRRMTPPKFNISHCIGNLTPLGKLLRIKGGGSTIEIIDIKPLIKHLPEYKEVEDFPGPLIKGTTHKNNVIQFCQRKIREAQLNEAQVDKENFILLWEYLILLLRQNGNVVGTDIAELLLKNTSSGESTDDISAGGGDDEQKNDDIVCEENSEEKSVTTSNILPVSEEKVTEHFCKLLLYGRKKDALEYAMNNALWGHAILLASKMDERTYGHVMARFANCTPYNHPLQTLYQVMSGKQPSSVTSCCDDSFGDWRPHLAMILSNAGVKLDVEVKAVITLGDTMGSRNHVYAAQFCYLMGEVEFASNSKLGPLLGLNMSAGNIVEATQMTEILEFARSLSQSNITLGPSFIQSKLGYTKTLLDYGFVQEAYAYCEEMTKNLQYVKKASNDEDIELLRWSILQISERLIKCENTDSTEEPMWIQQLRVGRHTSGPESMSDNSSERRDSIPDNGLGEKHDLYEQQREQQQGTFTESLSSELKSFNQGEQCNQNQQHVPSETNVGLPPYGYESKFNPNLNQEKSSNMIRGPPMPDSSNAQQQQIRPHEEPQAYNVHQQPSVPYDQQQSQPQPYEPMQQPEPYQQQSSYNFQNPNYPPPSLEYDMTKQLPPPSDPPSINTNKRLDNNVLPPNFANSQQHHFQPHVQHHAHHQPQPLQHHQQQPPAMTETKTSTQKKTKDKPAKGGGGGDGKQSSGWISGLFSKISMKPKNQMFLPDDKDPAIVWNPDLNKWVNTKDDEDDTSTPVGPPPSDQNLRHQGLGGGGMPPPQMMQPQPPQMMQPQPPQMMQPQGPQMMQPSSFQPHQVSNMSRPGIGVGMSSTSAPNVPSYAPSNPQLIENNYQPPSLNYVDGRYQNQSYTQAQPESLDTSMTNPGIMKNNNQNGTPDLVTGNNKYQRPKKRSARSGYVDILNPNNIAASNRLSNMSNGGGNLMSGSAGTPAIPNMFIPSPVMGSGDSGPVSFLTPSLNPVIGPVPPNETNS